MVRVFETFAKENQIRKLTGVLQVESAADHTPKPGDADYIKGSDVPWIRRFADAGGKVIISGNTQMQTVQHERLALVQAGMVVIFFENRWSNHRFWTKCAILLHWWPVVVTTIKKAPAPSFWRRHEGEEVKKPSKNDDPEQSAAFIKKARELETDEARSGADKLMGKLAKMKPEPRAKKAEND